LAALRLEPGIRAGLESVGLRTSGAVMAAPRAPLVRRFGRQVTLRLDQALGRVEEAISPRLPVPALSAERMLAEPIGLIDDVEALVAMLSLQLKRDLERRGEGAERLQLQLFRVDGDVSTTPHGDTDLGLHQRRRIVDTIAHHGDPAAALEATDQRRFLARQNTGMDLVDFELGGDTCGCTRVVAGEENGTHAIGFQRGDSVLCVRPQSIAERKHAEQAAALGHGNHSLFHLAPAPADIEMSSKTVTGQARFKLVRRALLTGAFSGTSRAQPYRHVRATARGY